MDSRTKLATILDLVWEALDQLVKQDPPHPLAIPVALIRPMAVEQFRDLAKYEPESIDATLLRLLAVIGALRSDDAPAIYVDNAGATELYAVNANRAGERDVTVSHWIHGTHSDGWDSITSVAAVLGSDLHNRLHRDGQEPTR